MDDFDNNSGSQLPSAKKERSEKEVTILSKKWRDQRINRKHKGLLGFSQ